MQERAEPPVTILYFAWLRERVGRAEEKLALPPGVSTVGGLIEHLVGLGDGRPAAFASRNVVRCAVNQDFAGLDSKVAPGDEVAFFPPVTGG
ncbi:MAG TPA: molybdopterin converting factor subunit 1 [Acetobacteraceae bacterium]|nr:molybdopterin converting factor subunit 1 [Acetobacteraceae bacterium]